MRTSRLLLALVVLLGVAGVTALALRDKPPPATASASVARTSLPGVTAATGAPTLPSLARLSPTPGTVVQAAGPFDDRFRLDGLAMTDHAVRGTATVTSDVSDLLEFEAVAGFYDRRGTLLGTSRFVHHLDEGHHHDGPPEEALAFRILVPVGLRDSAVSAAVGVPVLVNE